MRARKMRAQDQSHTGIGQQQVKIVLKVLRYLSRHKTYSVQDPSQLIFPKRSAVLRLGL